MSFNAIITKLPSLPVVVSRYDADFIESADKFLSELPNFVNVYNTTITEINNAGASIEKIGEEVNELKNETLNYKNTTYAYKLEAVNAANEIKSYVIPEEATYSKDDIDVMLNSLLTQVVAQTYQEAISKKGEINEKNELEVIFNDLLTQIIALTAQISILKGEING